MKPREVMPFTGYWCNTHGLVKTNRQGNCEVCNDDLTIVDTMILTKTLFEAREKIIQNVIKVAEKQ